MTPSRRLKARGYLTHHAGNAATPPVVAALLREVADDLDALPPGTGEVVDMTMTPAYRPQDGTTVTTYLDA